jgi:hypothetical protein
VGVGLFLAKPALAAPKRKSLPISQLLRLDWAFQLRPAFTTMPMQSTVRLFFGFAGQPCILNDQAPLYDGHMSLL